MNETNDIFCSLQFNDILTEVIVLPQYAMTRTSLV
jgi:hypothetical protein